jgi:thiol-disulfide isomerase/thioredoxin
MPRFHGVGFWTVFSFVPILAVLVWLVQRVRSDDATIRRLTRTLRVASMDRSFPQPGDSVADLRYPVTRGRDTVVLAELVRTAPAIVYFGSSKCGACKLLELHLDSLDTSWRSQVVRVSVDTGKADESVWRLVRDSIGISPVSVIPSAISVGSQGIVVASGLGGLKRAATVIASSAVLPTTVSDRLLSSLAPAIREASQAR